MPKPRFGSTNNKNTSRNLFLNPQKSSDITRIDMRLTNRFSDLIQALSSGCEISIEAFKKYALEKNIYLSLYSDIICLI